MDLQKPYVKKLEEIPPITIWEVDGPYIRQNLSVEFTNFGQHYRFSFIPKNEFWIDKEHSGDESQFFIDRLLIEYSLMSQGKSYDEAVEAAGKKEERERQKSARAQNIKKLTSAKEVIDRIHKDKLQTYSTKDVSVWVINGELVRDLFYVDFTEGGHEFVYDFIPEGEVWLDDDLGATVDRKYVLLHELYERNLMAKGDAYNHAHKCASLLEAKCRHNPDILDEELKKVSTQ